MAKPKYTSEEREASNRFTSLRQRANSKGINVNWERKDFISWYLSSQKKCYYCGCGLEEIERFHNKRYSKRHNTRGKSLEVDRLEDAEYSKDDCVLACYWCNNAKSDVFTQPEFMQIGKEIGKVIRKVASSDE